MTLDELVAVCKAYRDLGHAVGDQLDDVLDGRAGDANPNALRLIDERFLTLVHRVAVENDDDELAEGVVDARDGMEDGDFCGHCGESDGDHTDDCPNNEGDEEGDDR